MRIVRLGQGVDATGQFAPEAIERTKAALTAYAELLARHDVSNVRMVATSATRDAANRDVFFAMTSEVLGAVVPGAVAEVISGDEEARLSFHGAVYEMDTACRAFRRGRPRRRIHRGRCWASARWRRAIRPTSAACG